MHKNQNNLVSEGSNNSEPSVGRIVNNNGEEQKTVKPVGKLRQGLAQQQMGNLFLSNMRNIPRPRESSNNAVSTTTTTVDPLTHACLDRPTIPRERRRKPSHLFKPSQNNTLPTTNNQQ